jgi:hypothetical protein
MAKSKMPQRYTWYYDGDYIGPDDQGIWVYADDAEKLVNKINRLQTRIKKLEATNKRLRNASKAKGKA